MPKAASKTFESPYFFRAEVATLSAWLETGLRKPSAVVNNMGRRERALLKAWKELSETYPHQAVFSVNDLATAIVADQEDGESDIKHLQLALKIVVMRWAHCGVVWREAAAQHKDIPFHVERGTVYRLRSHEEVIRDWKGGRRDTQDNPLLWRKNRATGKTTIPKSVEKERPNIEATLSLATDYVQPKTQLAPMEDQEVNYPLTLALVTQLIEKCVRPSIRYASQGLESTIVLGGEQIKASTGRIYHHWERDADYGIMTADDAQLLLIILMRAASGIERDLVAGHQPVNRQLLDLKQVTQMISNGEPSPSAYVSLQKGMARLLNTAFAFEFDRHGDFAQKLTGATGNPANTRVRFQLLEQPAEGRHHDDEGIDISSPEWVPSSGMRYFSFSLHPLLWHGLVSGQGLGVHPQLVSERSGLLHKAYYHLRHHAGLERSYVVTTEQLMHRTRMVVSKNVARSRVDYSRQLWEGIRLRALQHSWIELPEHITEPTVVQFYDLNLRIEPLDSHKGALVIEARHSQETLDIEHQAEVRMARIKELALLANPGTLPRIGAPQR